MTRIFKEIDLREVRKSPASHAAVFMESYFISSRKLFLSFNLMSRMTIDVPSTHSVVHLLPISTLHGVNLRKKLWKCKEDNLVGGVLFYKSKVLVSCTQTCHDPVGHTSIQILSPVPIAP